MNITQQVDKILTENKNGTDAVNRQWCVMMEAHTKYCVQTEGSKDKVLE